MNVAATQKRLLRTTTASLAFAAALFAAATAFAVGNGSLTGRVVDTSSKKPVGDVVVTVTSPALQGEQVVVTDGSGYFRVPNLPPGDYTVRFDKETFKPFARGGVAMRADSTIQLNAELLPEVLKGEEIVVKGEAPTVDVGSTQTGMNIDANFTRRVPIGRGAVRSFEGVAAAAPGAHSDDYGTSFNGTTSPDRKSTRLNSSH